MRKTIFIFEVVIIGFLFTTFCLPCVYSRNLQSFSTSNPQRSFGRSSRPSPPTRLSTGNTSRSYRPSAGNVRPQRPRITPVAMNPQRSEGTFRRDRQGRFQRVAPPEITTAETGDVGWRGYRGASVTEISKTEKEIMDKELGKQGLKLVPLTEKPNEYALYNTRTKTYVKGQYFRIHSGESTIKHLDLLATPQNIKRVIGDLGGSLDRMAKAQGKSATYLGEFKSSEAFDAAAKKSPDIKNSKVGIIWGVIQEAPHAFRIIRWERYKDTTQGLRSQVYFRLRPIQ